MTIFVNPCLGPVVLDIVVTFHNMELGHQVLRELEEERLSRQAGGDQESLRKRRQPGQADLCESPFRQVQLAALGFELGDLDFELGEFDVWISASPHFVESTSQSGESEDNDFLVGLIGRSMLMQKGPVTADHAASSQRGHVLGTRTQRV